MRYSLFLIIAILACSSLNAQKLSKYYTSKVQDKGELYFLFPHDGFCNRDADSELEYDLTYLSSQDSVTFNFSYFDEHRRSLKYMTFVYSGKTISNKVQRIFVEMEKKKWHYRYTTKFSYADLDKVFSPKNIPSIILGDGKSGDIKLQIKKGKWEKQAQIIAKIFEMINYNQE